MFRIIIVLVTNLAIMIVFGIVVNFCGIGVTNIVGLMFMSGILGFAGAIISLFMSKYIALNAVGGIIIDRPCNEKERWLLQIVHSQSQRSGIVMPQVAIYSSSDMNAFATGVKQNSSLIAVSTGLLQNMSHDEVEAVIAHEISHIVSGDMVTMVLIQGIVNTFVIFISRALAQIASNYFAYDRDNNEKPINNGHPLIYFISSIALELVFGILATIITLWFSRYREFYADAGAAKLVGREKMIAALYRFKISCNPQEPSSIMTFCINGRINNRVFSEFFMSHPPLDKRIEALRSGLYLNKKRSIL